ncbi:MAG: hypothetical protein IPM79_29125 [Polyangiaceae bacterium]|nr:hypothetical protein [Polyangiaceae bacterium]MBK8941556.1 hypothetical protein [Polyangiaceae bacterium]
MSGAGVRARLKPALGAIALGLVIRVACGLAVGSGPSRWAAHVTRGFPEGERALFEHGAGLLLELLQRRQLELRLLPTAPIVALLGGAMALVSFGALVASLERPTSLPSALVRAGRRIGSLVLTSGLGALTLSLVGLLEVMALAAALGAASTRVVLAAGCAALLPLAAVACLVDVLRAAAVLAPDGGAAPFRVAFGVARRELPSLTLSYLAAVFVELLAALLGAIVVASLLFGSTLAAAGAALAALVALVIMALARAWFLAAVVKRIENVVLHRPTNLSYVSAPPSADLPR